MKEKISIFIKKSQTHSTFAVELSLAKGIIFTKSGLASNTILKLWAAHPNSKFSRETSLAALACRDYASTYSQRSIKILKFLNKQTGRPARVREVLLPLLEYFVHAKDNRFSLIESSEATLFEWLVR